MAPFRMWCGRLARATVGGTPALQLANLGRGRRGPNMIGRGEIYGTRARARHGEHVQTHPDPRRRVAPIY